jgi:hypothetical protein
MFAKLLVIAGPDTGKSFEVVPKLKMVLGRSVQADAKLSDPRVSPYHCRLEVRNGQLFVTDIDSTTGTAVNNVFVLDYPVQMGDTIGVGDTVLLVQDPDAKETVAPPPARAAAPSTGSSAAHKSLTASTKSSAAHRPLPAQGQPPSRPAAAPAAVKAAPKLPDRAEQLIGHTVSSYKVEKLIARGRGGIVFQAADPKGRVVALKVLHPSFSQNPRNLDGFTKAMKLAMPLRHANVVSTLGAGKSGPFCWVAMELVNGESLTATIRNIGVAGSLEWRRALRMAIYLARGLNYLHEQKVIYRNMGTQNIMIEGEAKVPRLSDFIRCRPFFEPVEPGTHEEMPDSLMLYASPEQTREELELEYRSDIFNLGSMTYQLLTGRPPFEGGSLAETITKIRREKPEDPKTFQLAIPQAFQGIVLQMLAKRPEDRYQTAAEVLRDLERCLKYQGMTL